MAEVTQIFDINEAKRIIEVGKALDATDNILIKMVSDMEKLETILKQNRVGFDQIASAQKQTANSAKELDAVGKQLKQSEEKLRQAEDSRTAAIIKNRQAAQKQKTEMTQLIRVQNAQKGSIEQLAAVNSILEKRLRAVNLTTDEGRKKADLLRGAIDKNTKKIMENSSNYSRWKINIGNYGSALSGLSPAFSNASMMAGRLSTALKMLLANPVVLIVSAIVAAFAGLVAILKSTDDGGTKLKGVFDGIKNVLGVLKNALSQVIEAFSLIREGKFRAAFAAIGDAAKYAAENVADAYKAGNEYAATLDKINDRITANISGQAESLRQFNEYYNLSKDQTLSDRERLKYLDMAMKASEDYYGTLKNDAKDLFDTEVKNMASRTKLTAEQLSDFIALDGKRAEEARSNNADIANAWNVLGDENIKTLEEMYAKSLEADSNYYKANGRLVATRSGILNRQKKEQENAEKEKYDNLRKLDNDYLKSVKESDKKIRDAKKEQIQKEIDANNEKYKTDLENYQAVAKAKADYALRQQKEEEERKKELMDTGVEAFRGSINAMFEIRQANLQKEFDALELQKEAELAKEGLTADEKQKIEEKYAKKAAKIKEQQAKSERRAAIINSLINTALAIGKALPNIPLAILAGTMGSIQTAVITAQPLPKFAKGVKGSPESFIAGEAGRELIKLRSGKTMLADRETVFSGKNFKGATVYSNPETEKIISASRSQNNVNFDTRELQREYRRGTNRVVKAIHENEYRRNIAITKEYKERFL